jgi:hypothetical protein
MTISNSTYYSGTPLARAWNTSTSVTTTAKNQATSTKTPTASPRSATDTMVAKNSPVSGVSNTPNYGTIHDQEVGVKLLGGLETISSLNDTTFGGITFESLTKAHTILMGINSTANLSPEQKSVLEAATNAWLAQNPSDATKVNDPAQARTIARKVADIFKTQILSNYTAATTATMRESNVLGRVALLGSKEFQTFFDKKLTTEQLAQEREKIGTVTNPITMVGQNPTNNLRYTTR